MPQTKTRPHNSKKPAAPARAASSRPAARPEIPEEDLDSAQVSFLTNKNKKEDELEDDGPLPLADKLEEASPFGEAPGEEDSAEEEAGLDEEELNPFGDKWEV